MNFVWLCTSSRPRRGRLIDFYAHLVRPQADSVACSQPAVFPVSPPVLGSLSSSLTSSRSDDPFHFLTARLVSGPRLIRFLFFFIVMPRQRRSRGFALPLAPPGRA